MKKTSEVAAHNTHLDCHMDRAWAHETAHPTKGGSPPASGATPDDDLAQNFKFDADSVDYSCQSPSPLQHTAAQTRQCNDNFALGFSNSELPRFLDKPGPHRKLPPSRVLGSSTSVDEADRTSQRSSSRCATR